MNRSRKWLALLSITALVLVTLLGGIVSALAGGGDGPSAAEQLVLGEGTESIVPVVGAAPATDAGTEAPPPQEKAEKQANGEDIVTVPLGESPDAGIECWPPCCYGKICVIKFLDANENGQKDEGETGMAGVTILLNGQDPKQTNAEGKVCYDGLKAGDYTVSEVVPEGYHATTPTSYNIKLCSSQTVTKCFGNAPDQPPPGSISGHKWQDLDGDGELDAGEPPLAGITIELWKDGEKIAETTTAADGSYSFTDLPAGDYVVKEIVPTDMDPTSPTSVGVELAEGQNVCDIDFFNQRKPPEEPPGSISGHKWEDLDGDGELDAGEPPLAGITIELWKDGEKIATTTTAADGSYSFTDLPPGDYVVQEIVPGDMVPTSPTSVGVELAVGQNVFDVDFLNQRKPPECDNGVIEALVRVDMNCNGIADEGDVLIDGVTIELYHIEKDDSLTPADGYDGPYQKLTGPGAYGILAPFGIFMPPYPAGWAGWMNLPRAYDGEPFAWYLLRMVPPEGYTVIGPSEYVLPLRCNLPCFWYQKEFLLGRTFYINGHKYEDINCNGVIDEGDPGVPGVEIKLFIYDEGSGEYVFYDSTFTDADGYYEFTGLGDGVYKVQEILTPELLEEWFIVSPDGGVYEGLEVGCGDSHDDLDFLNARYVSISGHKWDACTEEPVEGVTIELWKDGEKIAETTTDENGYYEFTNLVPGTYTVKEVLSGDWYPVAPDDGTHEDIQLACGQPIEDLDFWNARYTSISGNKWEDLDGDGELDEGEPPVEGVTIELWKDGEKIAETTTDENGYYEFTNLVPGTYTVKEVLPEGWHPTDPESGMYEDIELAACQPIEGLDFLNSRNGSICGYKYEDLDENGIMDEGEAGMDGITIELYAGSPPVGDPIATAVTADGGKFCFENLQPGTYTVVVDESTAIGYYPTGPISIEVELDGGENEVVYFGNAPYGSISGKKWLDANYDGIWDEEETVVIEGITIKLYAGNPPEGDPIATTVTGEDGYYEFTDLEAGTYTVVEEGGEGYFSCTSDSVEVTLSAGEGAVVDFGNCPYGRIEGLKFLDLDGDGAQDPNEPGLEGVEITLTGLGDVGAMAMTTSGEDGTFFFDKLLPGEYAVSEAVPAGYYATRPVLVEVVVGPGESITVVFANAPYGSIIGNKWIDDGDNQLDPAVDTPKAGITIELSGETEGGEPVSMETTTGEDGSYSFILLEAGDYTVTEIYDPEKMQPVTPDSQDVTLEPGGEVVVDFLNVEVEVGGEEITPPAGETLPRTGMSQLPLLIAAAMLVLLGLLLLAAGLRRRYQE